MQRPEASTRASVLIVDHDRVRGLLEQGTPAQFEFPRQANCQKIQGFPFSRSLPPDKRGALRRHGRITVPP